jgi:glucosylceramidase
MKTNRFHFAPRMLIFVVLVVILTPCCRESRSPAGGSPSEVKEPEFTGPVKAARVLLTAKESDDRLTEKGVFAFEDFLQPTENFPHILVDPGMKFQLFEGIGGALTDAAAETFFKLPPAIQDELLTAYFDVDKGIGYSLCRTHINSCDFSSESYAYATTPGDTLLSGFSVDHDLKYRIPFIKKALERTGGQMRLFASPWSPPAWMKTNNNMLQGGKLKEECQGAWADYYIRFFEAYQQEGISFWGLTVQNEPLATQTWESCIFTAEDELRFVRDYLGPRLRQSPFAKLKLMIWDHNRDIVYHRASTIFADPKAAAYVWGTAFHWYMGDHYENVKMVHDAFPDKGLVFSEGCGYPFSWENVSDWYWGEKYAEAMIMDFNNFTHGWTDWNILLDETGGPNHVGNFCLAPVIGDTRTGKLHFMNSYYYIGHFSKFIRPGARRIACSSTRDELLATAFLNTDGTVAVVILNKTGSAVDYHLWMEGRACRLSLPAHAIMTCIIP